ncbi:sigma 54-interacting transcriptional regulator [Desulfitobacterium sp.]|uniref:sigma 54-interacting transcriptional regulator n=1 Tax=Desulfitobacterium sp. TaxID=49981 RepID=UPI002BE98E5F|nr:sigma 54-interacting transcriptional regulator [Desulfitobacterium sp.]HVJ48522.1 sigma 54-interacting transcriptional regulator [Desulfitobacterium sp.]
MNGLISIGLSLLEYQKCVSTDLLSLSGKTSFKDAVDFFLVHRLTQVPIVDEDGSLLGILDSQTLIQNLNSLASNPSGPTPNDLPILDFVQEPEFLIYEEDDLEQNLQFIIEHQVSALVINRKRKLQGEIRLNLIVQALKNLFNDLECFVTNVIGSAHNGIVAISSQGTAIFYNHSAERILGFSAQEVIGKPILQYFPDSLTYKVLKSGEAQLRVPLTYGAMNVQTDFIPIVTSGRILGAVAIFKDVTELETVTDRLSTNEKLMATLEAVVENSYEGIIVIDEQEKVELINHFFLELMGLKAEDVIGKHINEISPESQLPNTLKTGQAQFGETWHIGGKDFLVMRAPVERDGKIVGALGKTLFKNMEVAKLFAKKVMRLEGDLAYYKDELRRFNSSQYNFNDIIGDSPQMQAAKELAARAARTNSTILLLGESGTGKEIFAHAIHETSLRAKGPLIQINCAAVPESLLESELFGYADGAFTGAHKGGKPGKFELADKGTIFLDEIGDMPLAMQAKLLRAIQEREVERVGGTQPLKIDVRVIAATNRDLHQMVIEHKFRLDLYYRLNVINIELPPLRERGDDLKPIATAILERLNHRLGTFIEGITPEAIKYLQAYDWPGNIRELENVLERAIITCDEPWIQSWHLSLPLQTTGDTPYAVDQINGEPHSIIFQKRQFTTLEEGLAEAERDMIHSALQMSHGNKMQAARLLGIHRSALYKKMAKHRLAQS